MKTCRYKSGKQLACRFKKCPLDDRAFIHFIEWYLYSSRYTVQRLDQPISHKPVGSPRDSYRVMLSEVGSWFQDDHLLEDYMKGETGPLPMTREKCAQWRRAHWRFSRWKRERDLERLERETMNTMG
jgi:hypothetical protein